MAHRLFFVMVLALANTPALGQEAAPVFTLGQILVTAPRADDAEIGGTSVSSEAIYRFNRSTLDEAASLIPGVTAANSGGSRNERLVFVRGFDRFQVPLSIDGIRVYLPADNRIDYGRFLTPDIAEIQVSKGYASVLDGPGALGGAINLVTRKPTKPLEGEARATLTLDRDGDYAGYGVFGLLGTRQAHWYVQLSYARNETDHWDLPGSYRPTTGSAENGGARDFSDTRDWRVNGKIGFTPNTTDEYALSYTRQEGSKNAPLHVTDPVASQRNWSWPYWNLDSVYLLTTTALGDRGTLKTRAYVNSFDNLLRAFDNRAQTTQTLGRAFNSVYADTAWGGSAELGMRTGEAGRVTLAGHYRRDRHIEYQQSFPSGTTEPPQTSDEATYSIAAEARVPLTPALRLTAGASEDWRDLKRAEEFGTPPTGGVARLFGYPVRDSSAFNWQGRLDYTAAPGIDLHASVSRRTRFPTLFERFSTQFGTAASNPGLEPERTVNYEIGGRYVTSALTVEAALFQSDIDDAIVAVRPSGFPANTSQRQNLGRARYRGVELSVTARVAQTLTLGGTYSYIDRNFRIGIPASGTTVPVFALTDVPDHKAFVYADWQPVTGLSVFPSLEIASTRTTVTTAAPATYYRTGDYVRADLRIDYAVTPRVQIGIGARNLFDAAYTLTDGFPEPGRSLFLSVRGRL